MAASSGASERPRFIADPYVRFDLLKLGTSAFILRRPQPKLLLKKPTQMPRSDAKSFGQNFDTAVIGALCGGLQATADRDPQRTLSVADYPQPTSATSAFECSNWLSAACYIRILAALALIGGGLRGFSGSYANSHHRGNAEINGN
jgi:hypothetical protein